MPLSLFLSDDNHEMVPNGPNRPCRWFQFRLGTLLAAMIVVAISAMAAREYLRRTQIEFEFEQYKAQSAELRERYDWLRGIMDEHTLRTERAEAAYLHDTLNHAPSTASGNRP